MKKKILLNTSCSILLQITTILAGLLLPRMILQYYGSVTNGLVNSITSFLGFISFAELGVGAVTQSALYRPLTDGDNRKISEVLSSSQRFYKKIAWLFAGYVIVLFIIFPVITQNSTDWTATAVLILAISVDRFAQYFFALSRSILLLADLKGYILNTLRILTLIANLFISIVLIKKGCSIQTVKLVSAAIFLIRPVALKIYVDRHYRVDLHASYAEDPMPQKWDGVVQHIAAVVIDNTDIAVLTLFSTLENVSVYSVYHMIVFGIRSFYNAVMSGVQSAFGLLWARNDRERFRRAFASMEVACHFSTVFLYSCAGILLIPFIRIYTRGITDVNYINLPFAVCICLARAAQCLRTPYNIAVLAAGHYRQTQKSYLVASVLNIVISIALVIKLGLLGVAIGTFIALMYQTVWMAKYDYRELVDIKIRDFIKLLLTDALIAGSIVCVTKNFELSALSYSSWIVLAVKVSLTALLIIAVFGMLFYRENVKDIIRYFNRKVNNVER